MITLTNNNNIFLSPGHEIVCGQTVNELIELLGLPDTMEEVAIIARDLVCDTILS